MMLREEFLELLRTDQAFREEVRRQLLTENLLTLPERFDRLSKLVEDLVEAVRDLTEAQQRTEEALQRHSEQIQALIEAQQRQSEQIQVLIEAQVRTEVAQRRTEEALQQLIDWQRGESGRREGERYEREMLRRAFTLFNGGQGGSPDYPSVQQRLGERLASLPDGKMFEAEEDPFLADLIWWKGEQVAVVEVSLQVNGYDVLRAARRADTLRRAGADAVAMVIGRDWTSFEAKSLALNRKVEWNVGLDVSEGFINFRRAPST